MRPWSKSPLTGSQAREKDLELQGLTLGGSVDNSKETKPSTNPAPLSSWVAYHKMRQMEWIVQLGFELDVYMSDELGGMYW
jgi:N-alpha-acetyltransferase 35, NatC auxiliary subunit